ncbi:hypothetical protein PTSG_03617 [Salpingoeca rosetta]|uniref:SH2 domain-containing protein n=1 Tax=Salpingoeca rosetta (strain ATCC 50818 / BSB-021) TaxID=946362 RepID=F2U639_SALR5|nr:uncharacterized protein PTSG_03617 [Salpingoeca rosetta]EGD82980.1 hypothetical protein PTSG_03617 [Salpingoeca rosetta]|eukprot:XP_004995344.1 hypothetical protein PTSG_03617 [Salpingoeca rosetta]
MTDTRERLDTLGSQVDPAARQLVDTLLQFSGEPARLEKQRSQFAPVVNFDMLPTRQQQWQVVLDACKGIEEDLQVSLTIPRNTKRRKSRKRSSQAFLASEAKAAQAASPQVQRAHSFLLDPDDLEAAADSNAHNTSTSPIARALRQASSPQQQQQEGVPAYEQARFSQAPNPSSASARQQLPTAPPSTQQQQQQQGVNSDHSEADDAVDDGYSRLRADSAAHSNASDPYSRVRSPTPKTTVSLDSYYETSLDIDLHEFKWFLGDLSREGAIDVLRGTPPGTFIVRTTTSQCILSVRGPTPDAVRHFEVSHPTYKGRQSSLGRRRRAV